MKTSPTPNILTRWYYIFRRDFIQSFLLKETPGKTWGFWCLWGGLISILIAGFTTYWVSQSVATFVNDLSKELPEFTVRLENHKFFLDGVEQPLELHWPDESGRDDELFLIDTTGNQNYDRSSFGKMENGFIVTQDKMMSLQRGYKYQEWNFADLGKDPESGISKEWEPFSMTKLEMYQKFLEVWPQILTFAAPFLGISIFLFFFVLPLLTALWWALVFWILGEFQFKVLGFTFGRAYLAVLNFYLPIMILEWALLLFAGISIPYSTTILFTIFFLANFLFKPKKR